MKMMNKIKKCTHCGNCCLSGIPCAFGQILFDITHLNPHPCPACVEIDKMHYCGLIITPNKWFNKLFGDVSWKSEVMADIVRIYNGVGMGCGISPSQKEISKRMTRYKKCRIQKESESEE
jgi:hypothetical protein